MTTSIGGVSLTTDSDSLGALTATKGNVAAADGTNWNALAVGTNGQVLTADSTQTNGVKWGTGIISSHAGLSGLSDDDHTQYLLVSGTRAATSIAIGRVDTMTVNGASVAASLQSHSDTQAVHEIHTASATAAISSAIYGARSRGTGASPTAVSSGDTLFRMAGVGYDGTDYATSAAIDFIVDATPGANDMPGRVDFLVSPDGSQTMATAMTIRSTGNIGIGAAPAFGAIDNGVLIKNSGARVGIRLETTAGASGQFEIYAESGLGTLDARGNDIRFTNAATELMRVGASGLVTLPYGQIKFPAAQNASSDVNTLDDYEEGTFTPTVIGTGTAGTGTYSVQAGSYTKVGRLVSFQFYINITDHTGTGNMQFAGLPFTALGGNAGYSACSCSFVGNVALTAANTLNAYVVAGGTTIDIQQYTTGGSASNAVPIDAVFYIMVSGSYQASA